jgi:hypothetical protein
MARVAGFGLIIWAVTLALLRPPRAEWGDAGIWFMAMVAVPLILRVTAPAGATSPGAATWRFAARTQPFAAALLGVALFIEPGIAAMFASLPWLLVAGWISASGLARVFVGDGADFAIAFGLLVWVFGAVWLVASTSGILGESPTMHAYVAQVTSITTTVPVLLGVSARTEDTVRGEFVALLVGVGLLLLAGFWGADVQSIPARLGMLALAFTTGSIAFRKLRGASGAEGRWVRISRWVAGAFLALHVVAAVAWVIVGPSLAVAGGVASFGFGLIGVSVGIAGAIRAGSIEHDQAGS